MERDDVLDAALAFVAVALALGVIVLARRCAWDARLLRQIRRLPECGERRPSVRR